jgi:hypothetical protein
MLRNLLLGAALLLLTGPGAASACSTTQPLHHPAAGGLGLKCSSSTRTGTSFNGLGGSVGNCSLEGKEAKSLLETLRKLSAAAK